MSATLADRERREKDATERYGVEVDIRLDHVVAYYIPCLWVKMECNNSKFILIKMTLVEGDRCTAAEFFFLNIRWIAMMQ